ncbi:nuclear transport factor 2 family protein [Streptomyces diastatochromogenes]|uniref:nuclear transport factor 2 family protein n=1 Tax=Streptomyces diastatochromogenes TaxID=42236 RepID=UPI001ABF171A|nr:nuclear transport factor 2 family protein [Streptomyces diastatochromogenes]MCZ0985938.1 nuclear transport factor 2 family protein [Streptomyces diastatochromogenes]
MVLTVEGTRNTELAVRVLRAAFEGGDTAVIDRYVRPDYIQHNPLAPDGPDAMKAFGAAWRQQFPDAAYDELRAVSEGDLVLLHSKGVLVPGTPGLAVFDIFRFQDGRIAEHWDILQEAPQTTANGNDMFATLSRPGGGTPGQRWFTAYNKKLVSDYVDQLLVRKDLTAVDVYLGPEYHEHSPNISDGATGVRAGLGAWFEKFPQLSVVPKRAIAEGDLVAVHSHYVDTPGERGRAVIDLFRVRDGKIVEHWDGSQDVPEKAANGNTMF